MATASNKVAVIDSITREQLYVALEESIKLLNHTIEQLNCYDGVNRDTFTPGTWILRMRETNKIK